MTPYHLQILERRIPTPLVFREAARRVWRKARSVLNAGRAERAPWTPTDVVDVDGPELSMRCYLEHRDIRAMIQKLPVDRRRSAVEIGCGYGRLLPVLQESFPRVIGVERDQGLLQTARELLPAVELVRAEALWELDSFAGPVDLAMVFTVLMHMTDTDARAVLDAMKKKVGNGWVLIVERTDAGPVYGDNTNAKHFMDHGRSIATFEQWMRPLRLIHAMPRTVEATHPRKDNGHYMLFHNGA